MAIGRVPEYSPHAVAERTVALMLSLNRRIHRAFECRLLGSDIHENSDCLAAGLRYVPLQRLLRESDVISLHCPLTPSTRHLIGREAVTTIEPGAMPQYEPRRRCRYDSGHRRAQGRQVGSLGIDVYEEEADLFFQDLSSEVLQDDLFARLLTFPNVLITGHQAFFTAEALTAIAETTIENVDAFVADGRPRYPAGIEKLAG